MFPNFAQYLAAIRSHIPWAKKGAYTSGKKQNSVGRICRDPSLKELRLPRRFSRKRISKIYRQPSIIRRAAELRDRGASFRKKRSLPGPNAEYRGSRVNSETARDKPLSLEENILAQYQELEARRTRFLTEVSGQHARLNVLGNAAHERLKQQAEHDLRARALRAKLKPQQRSAPFNAKVSALPSISKLADNYLQFGAACRAHHGCIERGEIPLSTPFQNEWSIWEKVRIRTEKAYAEVCENKRKAEAAREADARVEEKRIRMRAEEVQMQAEQPFVADEQKAADQDAAAARHASLPFIPPQTDDPELYAWEIFDRRWAAIKRESNEKVPFLLGFRQVPWPQFLPVGSLKDFNESNIQHFLLSSRRPGYVSKDAKSRIRQSILLYHPDKFNAHVLPHVMEGEREMVAAGASEVAAHLNSLLKSNSGL